MQVKSIKPDKFLINHQEPQNEEYKQPNKRELSEVPVSPVPCAEPEKI